MGPLRQGVKIYFLHQTGRVFKLYRDTYRCNYRLNIGIYNLRVAGARELLRCLSVFKLC